jgi:hypothetical protein
MFEYTKAELSKKANEYNFVRDTLEKSLRLTDVLAYLNTNPVTKNKLALKGGTAINLTVFNQEWLQGHTVEQGLFPAFFEEIHRRTVDGGYFNRRP